MSIKANELRVGNWAFWDGSPHQVRNGFDIDELVFEPIPITSEVLEKCGFNHATVSHRLKKNMFVISHDTSTFMIYDEDFGSGSGVLLSPQISQYVHQLQNLYFALAGEELPIQL